MTGAVTVAAFNRAPLARLTSPAPNSVLIAPATVALRAEVFDPDGSVTGVQFANGNALVNSDSTPPFAFTLTNMAPGSYSFTVRAGDNLGLRGTSAPVNVTVVAPLQLSGPAVGGGGFQFRYTADPGSTYVVEGSASPGGLSPFLPLATNVAGNNVETFMDPAALTLSNRAYRVFKQP